MKKREFTSSSHSKKAEIAKISLLYILLVLTIIIVFSLPANIVNTESENQYTFLDRVYFSGVTYFTIGFGDLVPHQNFSKLLVIVEGIVGVIVNGIFIGFFVSCIQRSDNRIQFTTSIYLTKNNENEFMAHIGIRNLGDLVVEIKRSVDILERCENNPILKCSVFETRNFLNNKSIIKLNEIEHKEILKQIQSELRCMANKLYLRLFLSGYDSKGNPITAFKDCELDVKVVNSIQLVTRYCAFMHKKKGISLHIDNMPEDQTKKVKQEFLDKSFD